jgi:hypothetical protein
VTPTLVVTSNRLTQVLDAVEPDVRQRLEQSLGKLGKRIGDDAKSRASAPRSPAPTSNRSMAASPSRRHARA